MNKSKTYTAILFAEIFWGLSFIWANDLIRLGVPVFTFVFIRLAIAGLMLWGYTKFTHRWQKIRKEDMKWLVMMAVFEPFLYFIGESFGLKATDSPTVSAVMIATIPVFVMILDRVVYRVKVGKWGFWGIVTVLAGIFVMMYRKDGFSGTTFKGLALLFLAVLSSTGYSVTIKKLARYNAFTITAWQFLIGSLFFLPCFFLFSYADTDFRLLAGLHFWGPLMGLAVFCSCAAFVLYVQSVKRIGITRAAIFTASIPVVSAVVAFAMGQEQLTWQKIAGMTVVIAGVIMAQRRTPRAELCKADTTPVADSSCDT